MGDGRAVGLALKQGQFDETETFHIRSPASRNEEKILGIDGPEQLGRSADDGDTGMVVEFNADLNEFGEGIAKTNEGGIRAEPGGEAREGFG